MNIPLFTGSGIGDLLKIDPARRKYPVAVGTPFQQDTHVRFIVPDTFRVKDTPKDVYIENAVGSQQVIFSSHGSDIVYYSRLIIKKGIIPADEAQSLLDLLAAVNAVRKEPILLEEQTK